MNTVSLPIKLERNLPLSLLFTLIMQLIVAISYMTYLEARVSALENTSLSVRPLTENVARVEERIDAIRVDIMQVRKQLDKLSEYLLTRQKQ